MRSIKAVAVLTTILFVASCAQHLHPSGTKWSFESGDYIITQESPEARQRDRSRSAQSFIFHLTKSGEIRVIARPPEIVTPRGIRAQRSGQFVFADTLGVAIKVLTTQGDIKTIHAGPPLTGPRDVATDHDGGYVVADFETFRAGSPAAIFKLTQTGKLTTIYNGRPLRQPHGIDVDRDGNYIIADHSASVFRLSPQGHITVVATGRPLVGPQDVKVDHDGNYIVTDIGLVIDETTGLADRTRSRNPGKLLKITPGGQVSVIAMRPMSRFRAIALHPDGSYIVVDMNDALYRITSDGTIKVIYEGDPLDQPAGIAIVP
jgi:sugar lactone lactonase YvrE